MKTITSTRSKSVKSTKSKPKTSKVIEFPAAKIPLSPHMIRHTTAMHVLQSGVDFSVIARWLGHESTQTNHQYLDADLELEKRALSCLEQSSVSKSSRPRDEGVLRILNGLL